MNNHTKTPWTIKDLMSSDDNELCIVGSNGAWIASVFDDRTEAGSDEADANAAFIVRACNAHEALVETCKELINSLHAHRERLGIDDIASPVVERAEAALAKAEQP